MEGQVQFLAPGVCHVDLAGESRRGPRVSLKASATALNSGPRGPGEGGPRAGRVGLPEQQPGRVRPNGVLKIEPSLSILQLPLRILHTERRRT